MRLYSGPIFGLVTFDFMLGFFWFFLLPNVIISGSVTIIIIIIYLFIFIFLPVQCPYVLYAIHYYRKLCVNYARIKYNNAIVLDVYDSTNIYLQKYEHSYITFPSNCISCVLSCKTNYSLPVVVSVLTSMQDTLCHPPTHPSTHSPVVWSHRWLP